MPADLIVRGRIATNDSARPWARAVAVRGERVLAVGDEEEVHEHTTSSTEVVDAGEGLVLPGFVDAHCHVRLGTPEALDLSGSATLSGIHERIARHVRDHPDDEWVEAGRWMYAAIPGGRMPTADDLPDAVTGGRPSFLISYDAHTVWMNRPALERFGIERGVTRVPFGRVEIDPVTGEPTGFLTEFAVLGLSRAGLAELERVLPGLTRDRQYRRLVRALELAVSYGITTVVEPQNSPDDVALFERAREEGVLKPRVIAAMFHPPGTTPDEVDEFEEARRAHRDDRFRVGPVKLYADDVIEPHTAAMLEDYADRPGERGSLFWEPSELADLVARLDGRGFQTFTHATGDRGVRTALDAVEHARRTNGRRDARHQIVHCEVVHPDDVPRFAELGVVACMQPRHCSPDLLAGDWMDNVGPARWPNAFPWRSLFDAGATLAFSSDWDVAEMDPLVGIYSALTRARLDGSESWTPHQTVDLETAIRAYTSGAAHANFAEANRGTIAAGSYADLVVLDRDLFGLEPPEILGTRVTDTLVGRENVYRAG